MFAERKRGSLIASKFKPSFFFYHVLAPFSLSPLLLCFTYKFLVEHSKDFFCLSMTVEAPMESKVRSDIMGDLFLFKCPNV